MRRSKYIVGATENGIVNILNPKNFLVIKSWRALTFKAKDMDCQPNSRKLTQREKEVITRHILDLDSRGFAPGLAAVRDIADMLLATRGEGQVGVHWTRNFVKRTVSLITRFNRAYDTQRGLREDPELICRWFELV